MSLVTLSKNLNFNFQYHEKKTNFVWEIEIWYSLTGIYWPKENSVQKNLKKKNDNWNLILYAWLAKLSNKKKIFFIKLRIFREIELQSEIFEKRLFGIWYLLTDKNFYYFFHRYSIKKI